MKLLCLAKKPKTVSLSSALGEHVLGTYFKLRFGMGLVAFLFPPALLLWGYLTGVDIQHALSDYYFSLPQQDDGHFPGVFPTRVAFGWGALGARCLSYPL